MKRRTKGIIAGVAIGLLLLAAAPLIIYVPPVQQWVAGRLAAMASEQTGMDISVGHVSLRFPLDLELSQVSVSRQGEMVADIGRAVASVKLLPLLREELVVDRLELNDAQLNTLDLISDTQIEGRVGTLSLCPGLVRWTRGEVQLSEALLSEADLQVVLSDTAATDTTASEPVLWRIAADRCTLDRVHCDVRLPGDTAAVSIGIDQATATRADIDLARGRYAAATLDWQGGTLAYDANSQPRAPAGIDYDHIALSDIHLRLDSIGYEDPVTRLNIRQASLKEQSGLTVSELHGPLTLDATGVRTPRLTLKTPHSTVYAKADIDYSVADSVDAGHMDIDLDAQLGRDDLALLLPDRLPNQWPAWPLTLKARASGNMSEARIEQMELDLPTVIHAEARGTASNLTDTDQLLADIDLKVSTQNPGILLQTAGAGTLPLNLRHAALSAEGTIRADGTRYTADLKLTDRDNALQLKGYYDAKAGAYAADADIRRLNVGNYVDGLRCTLGNAQLTLRGAGTDLFGASTWMEAEGTFGQLAYEDWALDNTHLTANLKDGHATTDITSQNRLVDGTFCIDAALTKKTSDMAVETHLRRLDLQALGLSDHPLDIGLEGDFDLSTDLKGSHKLSGLARNIYLRDTVDTYHPQDLGLLLTARPDTTYARLQNGNFIVKLDASGPYDRLADRLSALADTVRAQNARRTIDQPMLKQMLPQMRLYASSGRDNTLANILKASNDIEFRNLLVDLTASPETGLNGNISIDALSIDSTRIDTVRVTLKDSDHGLTFQANVSNNRRNPQFQFSALLDGHLYEHGMRTGLRFYDGNGRLGVRLGAQAALEDKGVRFTLMPNRPTLGYKEFALNPDNYLFLGNDMKLQAKVDLIADDGTGLKIYSESQDSTLLQDLTVSLHQVSLDQLTAALPYVPCIAGTLNGDFHLTMDRQKQISVASDMQVDGMAYEGSPMGNLNSEFVYMQREDDTHAIDGFLMSDGRPVASFAGSYRNKKETGGNEHLDGTIRLERTPLSLINGFIPDQLIGLEGYAEGELTLQGSLSHLDTDGEVYLDSAYLVSKPYGVRMRFDNDPVRIIDSKLLLENFVMYAYNDNPLNIMGNLDFSDPDRMTLDVRMRARDFMLVNAKQSLGSLAYGKGYVNFYATMNGPLDQLKMRGRLDVLGSTDLNYLLLDSPLSTDNQMDELVKFTDFSDSTQTVVQRPAPDGLDMDLSISIDEGAHVRCILNMEQSNYIDLYGGGDLRMRYSGSEDLRLTGRYTLTSGEMKYSLPVIPLKTFSIQDGSYVEFTGDPTNPTLNITATERNKAAVGQDGGPSRSVNFDCGVVITKTLNNMGLEFIISAPEDMNVQSELSAMGREQRGKLAVTMLTTGMYLADGNTGGFSMNSALSSFLQSEINQITGNALKTVDVSFGLDNTTDASGQMHTDYSFKFAKRFWDNRLKVQIGGKVSSGSEIEGQNQSFFDNVTMEYRLSPTSNQYVKLFYNQNAYDWLDGYTGEYGAGYIWKRKMDHWWEIFGGSSSQKRNGMNQQERKNDQ